MFNVKNRWFLGLVALFFIILLTGASCSNQTNSDDYSADDVMDNSTLEPNEDEQFVGNDKDEHGCIGSAGYIWCEAKEKCLRTWEEECSATIETIEPSSYASIAEEIDWREYSNDKLGYTVSYPGICNVMGDDLDKSVNFTGPLEDNEWWPSMTIAHNDSDFYRPPMGTDVAEWVLKFPELKNGDKITIAGLPALHFVQERSPQSYATDYYYFIKDTQLYQIVLVHTADRQDWPLYNKFLASFQFVK